jgi:hypothetical protein
MWFSTQRRGDPRRADEARRRRRAPAPALDPLEGRALLSPAHGAGLAPRTTANHPAHGSGLLYRGPLNERINGGDVVKHPEFYELYSGPRIAALDAIGSRGSFDHVRGFTFSGRLLGPVDPSLSALYVFLIDRGGAKAPGPYPHRSDIFFDAQVVVATGPSGTSGEVILLKPDGSVDSAKGLPAEDICIQGRDVQVNIDPSLIPSTSKDAPRYHLGEYRYAFSPRLSLDDPHDFASFVPEYITAPIGKPHS